jgi:hypothetical protein
MRVTTVATAGCLFVLMHAPGVFASDGPSRAPTAFNGGGMAAASCSEPTRVMERSASPAAGASYSLSQPGSDLQPSELGPRVTSVDGSTPPSARALLPMDEAATTLWCVTPDDPRCAPVDDSGRTNLSFGGDKLGFAAAVQPAAAIPRTLAPPAPPMRMDDTRDGVAGRIERPPRSR